mgnify:CR=1 FL=1
MNLEEIAKKMCAKGKGILAADESTGTIAKRFKSINVENTEKNRINFRQTLFSSEAMKNYIGGVILFDETIKQKTSLGLSVPELIIQSNSVPGIKVDKGAKSLAGSNEETITEGLDGLRDRLKEYYKLGARFAKWRGVYIISKEYPSKLAIYSNAHALARYAALVQESGMVPIVEPEVLMDGSHSSEDCYKKTSEVIKKCYEQLDLNKVNLKGTILKPNMILPGKNSDEKIDSLKISQQTVQCLKESVPTEVPGIAFLSGGQSEVEATRNLNEINKNNTTNFVMTYSYGRALQQNALKFWSKDLTNIKATQKVFNHRSKMCSLASKGEWTEELDKI